jgi:hypothetical protein
MVMRIPSKEDLVQIIAKYEDKALAIAFRKWHSFVKLEKTRAKNLALVLKQTYKRKLRDTFKILQSK